MDFLPYGVHLNEGSNERMCRRLRARISLVASVGACKVPCMHGLCLNEEECTGAKKRRHPTGKVMYEIRLSECEKMGHWKV